MKAGSHQIIHYGVPSWPCLTEPISAQNGGSARCRRTHMPPIVAHLVATLKATSSRRRIGWPADARPPQSARDESCEATCGAFSPSVNAAPKLTPWRGDTGSVFKRRRHPAVPQMGLATAADPLHTAHQRCPLSVESRQGLDHRPRRPRGPQGTRRSRPGMPKNAIVALLSTSSGITVDSRICQPRRRTHMPPTECVSARPARPRSCRREQVPEQ
jgi:hypothetical protein